MILNEALRILILLVGPVLLATVVAGILIRFIQSFFRVTEPALSYGVKLVTVSAMVVVVLPSIIEGLQQLLVACIRN